MNRPDRVLHAHLESATFLPVIVHAEDPRNRDVNVLDEYLGELLIGYSFGPPYGRRFLTWPDVERMGLTHRRLRYQAAASLVSMLDEVQVHGQPPALMLSFGGVESSLLLADEFIDGLERAVPGELVIGVPAQDVVLVTGSDSPPGLAKARRAVDRIFFAGNQNLLLRDLLVRRYGAWEVFR